MTTCTTIAPGTKIVVDPRYGYKRVDPLPSREELEQFYEHEFYQREQTFNDSSLEVQDSQREFFEWRSGDIFDKARELLGSPTRPLAVFDVGCGYGHALDFFRDAGCTTAGIEPSPEGVARARTQGHDVRQGNIERLADHNRGRFDIVLLLNVLEHLRDPADVLVAIREHLLAPSGVLVVDVPNEFNDFQVAADASHDLRQWWVAPPGHLNYFSGDSLATLLGACDYDVRCLESSFPMELFLLMDDVYVGDGPLGAACHEKRMAFERKLRTLGYTKKLRGLYQALARLNLGRQVMAYASAKTASGRIA